MKRIIVICEGPTEQEFCEKTLFPYFLERGIHIQAPLIKKTMGGIVKWPVLKKQIELHLTTDSTAYVTLLIDYYGLYKKHEFPGWDAAHEFVFRKNDQMDFIENQMKASIQDSIAYRFLPYIQLHEFEGLLFNKIEVFYENIPKNEIVDEEELIKIFEQYDNPEMINNSRETSPSHRLMRIIQGYNKVVYGNILAESIGLNRIREKCPRFNTWIENLKGVP